MAHTPGPWWYDKRTESIGCASGWLGRVQHTQEADPPFGNPDDDGQLMAAAPEMLAELESVRDDMRLLVSERHIEYYNFERIDAVIAKARGE